MKKWIEGFNITTRSISVMIFIIILGVIFCYVVLKINKYKEHNLEQEIQISKDSISLFKKENVKLNKLIADKEIDIRYKDSLVKIINEKRLKLIQQNEKNKIVISRLNFDGSVKLLSENLSVSVNY